MWGNCFRTSNSSMVANERRFAEVGCKVVTIGGSWFATILHIRKRALRQYANIINPHLQHSLLLTVRANANLVQYFKELVLTKASSWPCSALMTGSCQCPEEFYSKNYAYCCIRPMCDWILGYGTRETCTCEIILTPLMR